MSARRSKAAQVAYDRAYHRRYYLANREAVLARNAAYRRRVAALRSMREVAA